ncbi:hypothetical protein [Xanthomonas sp. 3058]|uniref:hypothetical protein n=1 Tax=Xanthomonas sp. 3058 TaxID=3035314 RepID=UPI0016112D5F|nr:hypothetical protein [Xanthomonas sp. 3058]MBB5866407.1 hypothetical protein [Xanthomonas sp. 3058]
MDCAPCFNAHGVSYVFDRVFDGVVRFNALMWSHALRVWRWMRVVCCVVSKAAPIRPSGTFPRDAGEGMLSVWFEAYRAVAQRVDGYQVSV